MPAGGVKDCTTEDNGKVTLCHATGSSTNPFVVITVSTAGAANGHSDHADDVIPAFTYNGVSYPAKNPGKSCGGGGGGGGSFCPGTTIPMPASGNVADCNPPKLCPNGSAMPASGNVADCNPPKLCPNGSAMPASGNVADCNPPVVCPAAGTMGPVPAGCGPIGGGTGGPATGPGTKIVPNSGTPTTPVEGTPTAPGAALPFTGDSTSLLASSAALMLLVGIGLIFATRKPKAALALV
jgi:hypothetical protein